MQRGERGWLQDGEGERVFKEEEEEAEEEGAGWLKEKVKGYIKVSP